jgi:hypothetical protein
MGRPFSDSSSAAARSGALPLSIRDELRLSATLLDVVVRNDG